MSTHTRPVSKVRAEHQDRMAAAKKRRSRLRAVVIAAGVVVAGLLVTLALLQGAPTSSTGADQAPTFTLPSTSGQTVSLEQFRGQPVVLFFNEGAGCGSCTVQMAQIEQDPAVKAAGITVLPIVMNSKDQILPDLRQYGVTTPYLLDDGTVSKAYGVLGTGMHAGLPGHSFVLIDKDGVKKWTGSYPSMWLPPTDLLTEVKQRL
ncbi:redoxin [Intrasporangium chromatireducens Q5-1]|uniref:Redoxin n=1 Tax=Intrasporangium chromatireducens Q5-1 TaxID=584657 RepID=W9GV16_9MICO|nr:peroxiredoxin family protein [Intrasporangium chromatireducens]EWT07719.1 redoxin [Intrasporangium chromatireducens Q5-1]